MFNSKTLKKLIRYKWIGISFAVSIILVLSGWIMAWLRLKDMGSLTLHFNSYAGINRTGNILDLHALGFLGVIILVLDWFLAYALEERDWFLGKLLAFAGIAVGILIFIGFMVIMNVN